MGKNLNTGSISCFRQWNESINECLAEYNAPPLSQTVDMKHEQNKWDSPQGWDREPCSSSIFFLFQKTQDDTVSNGDFSPHIRNGLPRYNLPLIISVALPTSSSSFSFTGTVTDFKPVPPYSPLPWLTVHQIILTVLIYRGTPPSLHLPDCLIPLSPVSR